MRGSVYGADYPAERFARTPISHIRRILTELDNKVQAEANLASATNAQLCFLVRQAVHVFSHSTTPLTGISNKTYLPFPDWKPPSAKPSGPSEMTALALRETLRRRELPMHVFVALITPIDESR